ncbi:hypothetical protein [Nocardioides pakistanensis]
MNSRVGPHGLLDRLTMLTGLGAVVLILLGTELVAPPPGPETSIATRSEVLATALAANADAARTGAACMLAGVLLLVPFVGRLHGLLVRTSRPGSSMPGAMLVAGSALVAAELFGAALALAAGEPDGYTSDPAVAKTLLLLGWNSAYLVAPGLAAIAVIWTVAGFTTSVLPRAMAWIGAGLVAVLALITLLGGAGLAAMPGFLWLVILSVTLAARLPTGDGAAEPPVHHRDAGTVAG